MKPTLRQLKSLHHLLMDLYFLKISPKEIKFSESGNKPIITLTTEALPDSNDPAKYCIDSDGELIDSVRKVELTTSEEFKR